MNYVSDSVFEEILISVLEERFPEIESITEHQKKTLFAVINHKDLFALHCQLDMESQLYFSCPDV